VGPRGMFIGLARTLAPIHAAAAPGATAAAAAAGRSWGSGACQPCPTSKGGERLRDLCSAAPRVRGARGAARRVPFWGPSSGCRRRCAFAEGVGGHRGRVPRRSRPRTGEGARRLRRLWGAQRRAWKRARGSPVAPGFRVVARLGGGRGGGGEWRRRRGMLEATQVVEGAVRVARLGPDVAGLVRGASAASDFSNQKAQWRHRAPQSRSRFAC